MITIYHLGKSQSDRIVWLMEELGLPYQLEWFERADSGLAPEEYRQLHPVGTAPVIRDGDLVLGESAAIVEYISQRHGQGRLSVSADMPNYPDYLYWMQFNSNVQSVFFSKRVAASLQGDTQKSELGTSVMQRREDAYFGHLESRLSQADYLAGDQFTCADIMAVFNLTTLPLFGGRTIDDLPNTASYIERIAKRPAYIRAMAIAGPSAQRPNY